MQELQINYVAIDDWVQEWWKPVYKHYVNAGFNDDEDTSLWVAFVTHFINWRGKRVLVFLTDSFRDWNEGSKIINRKSFRLLREAVDADCHALILTDANRFMNLDDLDAIYLLMEDKAHLSIDMSREDEEYSEEEYEAMLDTDDDEEDAYTRIY